MSGYTVEVTLSGVSSREDFLERKFTLAVDSPPMPVGRSSKRRSRGRELRDNAYFDSPVISRSHAEIFFDKRLEWPVIKDVGSLHGTSLNQRRLVPFQAATLTGGDIITIGSDIQQGDKEYQARKFRFHFVWRLPDVSTTLPPLKELNTTATLKPKSLGKSLQDLENDIQDESSDEEYDDDDDDSSSVVKSANSARFKVPEDSSGDSDSDYGSEVSLDEDEAIVIEEVSSSPPRQPSSSTKAPCSSPNDPGNVSVHDSPVGQLDDTNDFINRNGAWANDGTDGLPDTKATENNDLIEIASDDKSTFVSYLRDDPSSLKGSSKAEITIQHDFDTSCLEQPSSAPTAAMSQGVIDLTDDAIQAKQVICGEQSNGSVPKVMEQGSGTTSDGHSALADFILDPNATPWFSRRQIPNKSFQTFEAASNPWETSRENMTPDPKYQSLYPGHDLSSLYNYGSPSYLSNTDTAGARLNPSVDQWASASHYSSSLVPDPAFTNVPPWRSWVSPLAPHQASNSDFEPIASGDAGASTSMEASKASSSLNKVSISNIVTQTFPVPGKADSNRKRKADEISKAAEEFPPSEVKKPHEDHRNTSDHENETSPPAESKHSAGSGNLPLTATAAVQASVAPLEPVRKKPRTSSKISTFLAGTAMGGILMFSGLVLSPDSWF